LVPRPRNATNKISYSAEAIDTLLVDLFLEAHPRAPREIVLDLDATDTPLHGRQEARFFHGYYGHYCYLPLYVFCGDHLLCARLRPSNIDASAGSLERSAAHRAADPRAVAEDQHHPASGLRLLPKELLGWCENNDVDYVFGFARNKRLRKIIRPRDAGSQTRAPAHGKTGAGGSCEFAYRTKKSWSRARRVVAKAEQIEGKENPATWSLRSAKKPGPRRTSMNSSTAREAKWRIASKSKLSLFADRMSTETLRANQLRLYFSSLAYVLVEALRRLGLAGTEWAEAQADTSD